MQYIYKDLKWEGICTSIEETKGKTRLSLRKYKGAYAPEFPVSVPRSYLGRHVVLTETLERKGNLMKKSQKLEAEGLEPLVAVHDFFYEL